VAEDRVLLTITVQVTVDEEMADAFEGRSKRARARVSAFVARKIMDGDYEVDSFS
jgi:hypothetical protein